MVLLHAIVARAGPGAVHVVHVDHGLQPQSGDWARFVLEEAAALGTCATVVRLVVAPPAARSIEDWARERRYEALERAARELDGRAVVIAHHADDQVETLLLNLGRGAGLDGLSAMPAESDVGAGRGVARWRPLLAVRRRDIADYAARHAVSWIDDPSNTDVRRRRNALRHDAIPALAAAIPGFEANARRAIAHLQSARRRLDALAREDLESVRCADGRLDRAALVRFETERCMQVLRMWTRQLGLAVPTQRRLREMMRQLVEGAGAHGSVTHDGIVLRRHRDRLWADRHPLPGPVPPEFAFVWQGEPTIALPAWCAALEFASGDGPAATHLRGRRFVLRRARALDRLRPRVDAASRTVKNLFQEAGVPPSLRAMLPAIEVDGRLLAVAGLGFDRSPGQPDFAPDGVAIRLRPWAPDDPRHVLAIA